VSLVKHFSFVASLAICGICFCVGANAAGPQAGQGTWETTLKARDASGHAVALDSARAEFFYDTTTNVTWLADMNIVGEPMYWEDAKNWANRLTLLGYDDWRLPNIIDSGSPGCDWSYSGGTDCGYNVQTKVGNSYSEWAHLFYVTLGDKAFCPPGMNQCQGGPQPGWGRTNTAYFRNMGSAYWSGTENVATGHSGKGWYFVPDGGDQWANGGEGYRNYVVAVRSGDVLTGAVPEVSTLWMVMAGLAAIGLAYRRVTDIDPSGTDSEQRG